jgi:hypothetical protein
MQPERLLHYSPGQRPGFLMPPLIRSLKGCRKTIFHSRIQLKSIYGVIHA